MISAFRESLRSLAVAPDGGCLIMDLSVCLKNTVVINGVRLSPDESSGVQALEQLVRGASTSDSNSGPGQVGPTLIFSASPPLLQVCLSSSENARHTQLLMS